MQAPQQLRRSMRKGSRLTFGHLSYVASYKHPTARKSRGRSHNKLARPAKCNRGGIRLNRGLQGHHLGLPSPRGQSAPQRANASRTAGSGQRRSEPGRTRLVRYVREIEAVAPSVGIRLIATPVHATAEIERVIRAFAQGPNGGLLILPSPTAGLARRLWEAYRRRHRDVQQRKQRR
jgi:hypothetical protein